MSLFLNEFGVNSYKELLDYIANNPNDSRVQQLKEIVAMFGSEYEERK